MEASEQIELFQEFFEQVYLAPLTEQLRKGDPYLNVNFSDLSQFNPELAEQVLETPEDTLKAAEIAVERFDLEGSKKNFHIRLHNLPPSQFIFIRDIRSKHINKFAQLQGLVRQKSDVRPQVTSAKFECPSCGNLINVLQLDTQFKEPSQCSCGRRGKFRQIAKELVDAQKIVLEEAPEDLEGSEQPKRINIFLKNDLVSPLSEKRTNPGTKIIVTGVIKETPIINPGGIKSVRYDLSVDANHLQPMQEDFLEIDISSEEQKAILELSKDPLVFEKLISSIAPSVYGHERVKEALILQLFGGVRKVRNKGDITRGDTHILLIGDPGSGKSVLLRRIASIAPKARYVSGKGASGAGLTASVVKDEFMRGWALEAGAMVLANKGLCAIDELDKMTEEDRSAMHESLEQQTVTITKANIQATLRAETTVLAAANPKFGRFDPYELLAKQIDLPSTLINRFDLIFPVRDLPDVKKDEKMAEFVLRLHQGDQVIEGEIKPDFIKKYIAYSKQNIKPKLTESALNEIKDFYVKMRNKLGEEHEGIKAIPISARQLEALVRLSEAGARVRLSEKVMKKDAQRAIDLVHYCLSQIGLDPETGKIDIDRITTGITATQRSHIAVVRDIINELEKTLGKLIPYEDIVRECELKGVDERKTEEVVEKLKRAGDLFSPKPGMISKI